MSSVIILADHDDRDLNRVQGALETSGTRVVRLELAVPQDQWDISYDFTDFTLEQGERRVTESAILDTSVFVYRRWKMVPEAPVKMKLATDADSEFAEREWQECLDNVLVHIEHCFPHIVWGNPPSRTKTYKQWMLSHAAKLGFSVPTTLIGTRLARARLANDDYVAKAIGTNEHLADGRHFPTSLLTEEQLDLLGQERASCPSCVQQLIPKRHELRVTVAFDEVVALKLTSAYPVADIRLLGADEIEVDQAELDPALSLDLLQLTRELGLGLCSYDVLVDKSGHASLVDITPNGSWWFFEDRFGEPVVSQGVAKAITAVIQSKS